MDNVLSAAKSYLSHGWSVIPIRHGSKEPSIQWKRYQRARATEDTAARWFRGDKRTGIAIVCGSVSGGLVVRDFDDAGAYRDWSDAHSALAKQLPTVATARGFHVYARMDPCPSLKNLASGELRGNGGYVVAPPSIHQSGRPYRWIVPLLDDADLPTVTYQDFDLTEEDRRTTEDDGMPTEDNRRRRKITEAVEGASAIEDRIEAAVKGSVPSREGQRNKSVFGLARRLLAIFGDTALPPDELKTIFDRWWALSCEVVGTKDRAQSLRDFLVAYTKAETPLEDVVGVCLARAAASPRPCWSLEFGDKVSLLAALCRELHRASGNGVFFLSVRTAGAAIGVSHTVAAEYLNLFVLLGKLRITEKGKPGASRATRFEYIANE